MTRTVTLEIPDELYEDLKRRVGNDPEGMRLLFIRALARDELIQSILPKQFFYFYDNDYRPVDFSFNPNAYRKASTK